MSAIVTFLQSSFVMIAGTLLLLNGAALSFVPFIERVENLKQLTKPGLYAALFGAILLLLFWVAHACFPVYK